MTKFRIAPLAGGYVREKTRQPRDLEVPVRVSAGHGQERVQVSDDPSLSCDDETIYFENDPIAWSISSRSKSGRGKKGKKERHDQNRSKKIVTIRRRGGDKTKDRFVP